MRLLSTCFRHGNNYQRQRRRWCHPFSAFSSSSSSPHSHWTDDDNNENYRGGKHRPAMIKQQQHHLLYHDHHHHHPRRLPIASASAATTLSSYPTETGFITHYRHHHQQQQQQQYHTTTRKEILPFIIVGGILGIASIYTYKTFQQIDQDWENYYKAVEEYKAKTGIDLEKQDGSQPPDDDENATAAKSESEAAENANLSAFFTGGILAIDLGTKRMKLSHLPRPTSSLASSSSKSSSSSTTTNQQTSTSTKRPTPVITVDREGYRYTPSMVWIPPSSSSDEEVFSGRLAEARLYDVKEGRTIPLQDIILDESSTGNNVAGEAAIISQAIRSAACNALDQVLGGSSSSSSSSSSQRGSSSNNKYPLFVLDESLSILPGSYNVRPIFTYPTITTKTLRTYRRGNEDQSQYLEQYQRAIANLTSPVGIASYVPEPIAIVAGAEYFNLLPPPMDTTANNSILVVDVGGTTTCVSLVRGEVGGRDNEKEILYSTALPFGGDTFIDLLISSLAHDFFGQNEDDKDDSTSSTSSTILSTRPKLNDSTALQRLHEASTTAIHELSNKTRSEINVPYLTMDMATRQPRHLKLGVSRNVVNSQVETWIRNKLVPHLMRMQNHNSSVFLLSQATPPPTNLSTLFSSTIMCALEQTSHTPFMLRAILVVGGGARIPVVREAMREGVGYLAGEAYALGSGGKGKRLIMPEGEMCDEMGVLGAALWGSMR